MPLSKMNNTSREEIYFRHLDYVGYRRDDDLWDIEGHFKDLRSCDTPCLDRPAHTIFAGEPFHEMYIRLTVDDELFIKEIEINIENAPYKQCPLTEVIYQKLIGLQIKPGFSKDIHRQIQIKQGCTHLFELIIGTAQAAFQTIYPIRMMKYARGLKPEPIDTCLAWDSSGEMVKTQWPQYYQEKE